MSQYIETNKKPKSPKPYINQQKTVINTKPRQDEQKRNIAKAYDEKNIANKGYNLAIELKLYNADDWNAFFKSYIIDPFENSKNYLKDKNNYTQLIPKLISDKILKQNSKDPLFLTNGNLNLFDQFKVQLKMKDNNDYEADTSDYDNICLEELFSSSTTKRDFDNFNKCNANVAGMYYRENINKKLPFKNFKTMYKCVENARLLRMLECFYAICEYYCLESGEEPVKYEKGTDGNEYIYVPKNIENKYNQLINDPKYEKAKYLIVDPSSLDYKKYGLVVNNQENCFERGKYVKYSTLILDEQSNSLNQTQYTIISMTLSDLDKQKIYEKIVNAFDEPFSSKYDSYFYSDNDGVNGNYNLLKGSYDRSRKAKLFEEEKIPSPADINQTAIGDCYFLAALISLLNSKNYGYEHIKKLFKKEDDSHVEISLYRASSKDNSNESDIDENGNIVKLHETKLAILPKSFLPGASKSKLWVNMLEKAYVAFNLNADTIQAKMDSRIDPDFQYFSNKTRNMSDIEGGFGIHAFMALTGEVFYSYYNDKTITKYTDGKKNYRGISNYITNSNNMNAISSEDIVNFIDQKVNGGCPVAIAFIKKIDGYLCDKYGKQKSFLPIKIYKNHMYSVYSVVVLKNNVQYVILINPWNGSEFIRCKGSDVADNFDTIDTK